jgi:ectoine hydroxylase-related dioxygenase (phytanoyl-CoA dioxygenase family)
LEIKGKSLKTKSKISEGYQLSDKQISDFQTNGHLLLRQVAAPEEINFYRPIIRKAAYRYSTENRNLSERNTYGKAFLQITNLWERDETVKKFVFAKKFAQIAADLLGVEKVRLYHDQALFKEPKGGHTPWHQDQFYWNLDTDKTVTMWMPLVDISAEMGTMKFVNGSHQNGLLENISISDESEEVFAKHITENNLQVSQPEYMNAGDATFHTGLTIHGASANLSETMREVMTIIYFADGTRIAEPINKFQAVDHRVWLDSISVGELANGRLNPIIN